MAASRTDGLCWGLTPSGEARCAGSAVPSGELAGAEPGAGASPEGGMADEDMGGGAAEWEEGQPKIEACGRGRGWLRVVL